MAIELDADQLERLYSYLPAQLEPDQCWIANHCRDKNGYNRMCLGKKTVKLHRIAYTLAFGQIPEGLLVCHKCDVPACVAPHHLFVGTVMDNNRDCCRKGRARRANGIDKPNHKMKEKDIFVIRKLYDMGFSYDKIGLLYSVSQSAIGSIIRGETWKHIVNE